MSDVPCCLGMIKLLTVKIESLADNRPPSTCTVSDVPCCLGMIKLLTVKIESLADNRPPRMPHDSMPREVLDLGVKVSRRKCCDHALTSADLARRMLTRKLDDHASTIHLQFAIPN